MIRGGSHAYRRYLSVLLRTTARPRCSPGPAGSVSEVRHQVAVPSKSSPQSATVPSPSSEKQCAASADSTAPRFCATCGAKLVGDAVTGKPVCLLCAPDAQIPVCCPTCGCQGTAAVENIGKPTKCRECGKAFRVTVPSGVVTPTDQPKDSEIDSLVVAVLIKLLRNTSSREQAALALVKLGPAAKPAIKALVDVLYLPSEETSDQDKIAVAKALGAIGPDAKETVASLKELQKHKNQEVQRVAAGALKQIERP